MSIAEKLQTIAENEQIVYDAGYAKGKAEGGDTTAAYDEGFEAGKKAEHDAFWDDFQNKGSRDSYQYTFAEASHGWTDNSYNPKYPIICSRNAYAAQNVFHYAVVTDIKVPMVIRNTRADYVFAGCIYLKRIPSLTLENVSRFVGAFTKCNELETLIVHGAIEVDGFDVQYSTKLSKESIESIIAVLSTTTSGLTVTLSTEAVNRAFETTDGANDGTASAEWKALKETKPNWNIGYA